MIGRPCLRSSGGGSVTAGLAVVRDIQAAGHEIGHHGYMHEYLAGADQESEETFLQRGLEGLEAVTGERPLGYRAPGFTGKQHRDGGVVDLYPLSPGSLYASTSTFCMFGSALNSSAP
jgi:hypothetical protein